MTAIFTLIFYRRVFPPRRYSGDPGWRHYFFLFPFITLFSQRIIFWAAVLLSIAVRLQMDRDSKWSVQLHFRFMTSKEIKQWPWGSKGSLCSGYFWASILTNCICNPNSPPCQGSHLCGNIGEHVPYNRVFPLFIYICILTIQKIMCFLLQSLDWWISSTSISKLKHLRQIFFDTGPGQGCGLGIATTTPSLFSTIGSNIFRKAFLLLNGNKWWGFLWVRSS